MSRRFPVAVGVALLVAVAATVLTEAQSPAGIIPPDLDAGRPGQTCSTLRLRQRRDGWRPAEALAHGRPLSFNQEPTILPPNYTGQIVLREFYVAGDVGTLGFKPFDADAPPDQTETWTRTATTQIGGRLISVFTPSWPASRLAEVFRLVNWGHDYPYVYWGEALPPGTAIGAGYPIYLRVGSTALPVVSVTRLAPDVQYSSAVVNIRHDGFATPRLGADEADFDFATVTRRFYDLFEDTYDAIAMTTQETQVAGANAFHISVRNDVTGIGEPLYNNSATYGSGGRLQGVELFYGPHLTTNATSAHEAAHQWGAYINWTELNGLARTGHQTAAHDPLMNGGETLLGSVLDGTRRVVNNGSAWVVERTPGPILFHPLTLYAMGVIGADAVPELTLFNEQGQFGGNTTPEPGTVLVGGVQTATISNVIGMIGDRSGPVPSEWQRAVVVVSKGRLLTQEEMNYWTFYAQRTSDPNGSGVLSYDGFGSFDLATQRRVNLVQAIRPKAAPAIVQPLPVDYPNFSGADLRGIQLDAPVATLMSVGSRLRLTGTAVASELDGADQVHFYFANAAGQLARIGAARLGGGGSFVMDEPITEEHRGRQLLAVFLLRPGTSARARVLVGPITVN